MPQLQTLTVIVQDMHFFGVDENDEITGPGVIALAGIGNGSSNYYVSAWDGKKCTQVEVAMEGAPPEALAALTLTIREWFHRKQIEQVYINLFAESLGDIILTVTALDPRNLQQFSDYWNNRQIVWGDGGGIKYFE